MLLVELLLFIRPLLVMIVFLFAAFTLDAARSRWLYVALLLIDA